MKIRRVVLGVIAATVVLGGCAKQKEIKVTNNAKESVVAKIEENKPKSEPELKRSLKGLEGQDVLFWIDNNNILTAERTDDKFILYSYNLEAENSTEILNKDDLKYIYGTDNDGVVLLGNEKKLFEFDAKTKKLEEILDFDKEFKNGIPGAGLKVKHGFMPPIAGNISLIKRGYITYVTKINGGTAEYAILDYKNNKRNTIESRYSCAGINCKMDLSGKNIYIGEFSKLTKLNLENGQISSMPLSMPNLKHVFEDGTIFAECIEENGSLYDKLRLYRVDFDNKKVTRYNEKYEDENIESVKMNSKNKFFTYRKFCQGKDEGKIYTMYGTIDDNKLIVKGKIFKNNEDNDCNTISRTIFSPDQNRFIADVIVSKENYNDSKSNRIKDNKYLFELK